MKATIYLSILLLSTITSGAQVSDDFNDGVIDSQIWTVYQDNGSITEAGGTLQFTLNGGPFDNAMVELKSGISTNLDFRISADITYQFPSDEGPIFGMVVFRELESGMRQGTVLGTSWTNSIAASVSGPDIPYNYVIGDSIGSSQFTFSIEYLASDQLLNLSVFVDDLVVDTISHSLSNGQGADLSTNWNLSPDSKFGVLLVSESSSKPVTNGTVYMDSFNLVIVPEPTFISLVFGVLGVLLIGSRKLRS